MDSLHYNKETIGRVLRLYAANIDNATIAIKMDISVVLVDHIINTYGHFAKAASERNLKTCELLLQRAYDLIVSFGSNDRVLDDIEDYFDKGEPLNAE